ncbi:hypothetical protein ACSEU9_29595, partial [Pseudomonas aeruginosa]
MKLILDFDGRLLNPSNMLEALSKTGKNTTISISNAQALNIDTLLKATTTAENTKNLSTTFNGAELTANNLQEVINLAGSLTRVSTIAAQAININTLLSAISTAGNSKSFSAEFNGAQLSSDNLLRAVNAAGTNTSISVNTAQAANITALLQTIHAAGNTKTFSAEFNGAQLTSNNIQQALDAAGTRTSISVNTAQAVNISTLLALINSAKDTKKFSADFNGAQLTADNLQQAISAAASGTSISVNTAQAVNISTLLALINSAKDTKKFSADFNGAQLTADNLQQAISAAASGTSISVNTAQAANISTLLQAINIAGNTKKFSANFNGAQLTSNNIQQALRAAGSNTSISMNSAQSANQSTLLELLDIASSSKQFQANYNGGMSNPS